MESCSFSGFCDFHIHLSLTPYCLIMVTVLPEILTPVGLTSLFHSITNYQKQLENFFFPYLLPWEVPKPPLRIPKLTKVAHGSGVWPVILRELDHISLNPRQAKAKTL